MSESISEIYAKRPAALPLTGDELFVIAQDGVTKGVKKSDIGEGGLPYMQYMATVKQSGDSNCVVTELLNTIVGGVTYEDDAGRNIFIDTGLDYNTYKDKVFCPPYLVNDTFDPGFPVLPIFGAGVIVGYIGLWYYELPPDSKLAFEFRFINSDGSSSATLSSLIGENISLSLTELKIFKV